MDGIAKLFSWVGLSNEGDGEVQNIDVEVNVTGLPPLRFKAKKLWWRIWRLEVDGFSRGWVDRNAVAAAAEDWLTAIDPAFVAKCDVGADAKTADTSIDYSFSADDYDVDFSESLYDG